MPDPRNLHEAIEALRVKVGYRAPDVDRSWICDELDALLLRFPASGEPGLAEAIIERLRKEAKWYADSRKPSDLGDYRISTWDREEVEEIIRRVLATLPAREEPGRDEDYELREAVNSGRCTVAGPWRGDCEHAVGLPGRHVPGQHDGPDDTVDAYGKPNGWCWSCWKAQQIKARDEELARLTIRLEGITNVADYYLHGKVDKTTLSAEVDVSRAALRPAAKRGARALCLLRQCSPARTADLRRAQGPGTGCARQHEASEIIAARKRAEGGAMKLTLVSADFDDGTITLKVPVAVVGPNGSLIRLHYHPCEVEVDLTEFTDAPPVAPEPSAGERPLKDYERREERMKCHFCGTTKDPNVQWYLEVGDTFNAVRERVHICEQCFKGIKQALFRREE